VESPPENFYPIKSNNDKDIPLKTQETPVFLNQKKQPAMLGLLIFHKYMTTQFQQLLSVVGTLSCAWLIGANLSGGSSLWKKGISSLGFFADFLSTFRMIKDPL